MMNQILYLFSVQRNGIPTCHLSLYPTENCPFQKENNTQELNALLIGVNKERIIRFTNYATYM